MVFISSAYSLSQRPCHHHHASFTAFSTKKGIEEYRKQSTIFCRKNYCEQDQEPIFCIQEQNDQTKTLRRQVLLQLTLTTFCLPNAFAAEKGDFRIYIDEMNKFQISIPQDWQVGKGEPNGFKSVTAFYPTEDSNSNVSVVITGVGPDFTRMESFGKVEAFADTLVSGLDRSWQRPPGVAAKLIDCRASKGFYYIEYTLQNPGESCKHLYSAIGMASNGWYNRLYTVTGQFLEEESKKYSSSIEKAVASFKFI